jgi:hypothetical protein
MAWDCCLDSLIHGPFSVSQIALSLFELENEQASGVTYSIMDREVSP